MYSTLTLGEKDNQDNQQEPVHVVGHKRKAPGELEKVNLRHVETSGKWPRWHQWNPNKGPYNRVENHPLGMEGSNAEFEDNQDLFLPQDTMNTSGATSASGAASSSGGTSEVVQITEVGDDVYWDADGVWEQWGGDWWKRHPTGWWEKWTEPTESEF